MSDNWSYLPLGNFIEITHGFTFKGEFFCDEPTDYFLLTPGNFAIGGGFQPGKLKYYRGPVPQDFILPPGELVVTMTDLSKESDTLGYPAILPFTNEYQYLHNQRIGRVIITNKSLLDKRFLYYLLRTKEYRDEILASATGTAVKHTAPVRIKAYKAYIPSLPEQQAIARILGALDDKIELNRRMNRTLEAMAAALFKSWFVDFDPVVAKSEGRPPFGMSAETAALFPSAFAEKEHQLIPRGWDFKPISEVVYQVYDGPHATPKESDTGPVYLGIKNLTGTGIDLSEIRHISETDWPRWIRRIEPQPGDIVFSYEAALGNFALIPPGLRCCLGRRLALIRPLPSLKNHLFLFHTFIGQPFQALLQSRVNPGSTVDRILLQEFPTYRMLYPTEQLIRRFEEIVNPMWKRIHLNNDESRSLVEIRDRLLPKLLSGEVRLRQAAAMIHEL